MGGHRGSAVQGIGNSITVMIIDSCPSTNAWNYCKTDVDLEEKCMSRARNSLDIERQAYQDLTGQPPGSVCTCSAPPTGCRLKFSRDPI